MSQEDIEGAIYMMMLLRPDHAYVAPEGNKIYLLTADQDDLIVIHGEGFHLMDEATLNATIQDALKH